MYFKAPVTPAIIPKQFFVLVFQLFKMTMLQLGYSQIIISSLCCLENVQDNTKNCTTDAVCMQ